MLFNPSKFLILMLYASTSFMITLAGSIGWYDPQALLDPNPLLRNSVNDELWHDSMEVPEHENRIYAPIPKSKLQDLQQQQKVGWREAADSVKKWLNNHVKSNLVDSDGLGHQAKRNGAGYMCHFKLCQQNLANSGKRRWNPASYD